MYCDYHVHTDYSDDSVYLMEDIVKDAIAKGIKEICFTDHVDYGIKIDWDEPGKVQWRHGEPMANVDYPKYFKKIAEMKEKYGDQITIKEGMEFGMQTHTIPQFKTLFDKYHFDFIILSCHQVEDKEFWTQDFQAGRTQDEYQQRYYQEIYEVISEYKDYCVLGHLDLLKRYDQAGDYPFEKIEPMVTKILKQVIADGKGIEINTSSHAYGLSDLMPSRQILKLYHDLGGTIVTIGSDTHKAATLGAFIEETKEEMRKIGFKYYCTYKDMKPIFHEL